MNALEELTALNDLVPQELRLALQNCTALDEMAFEARRIAEAARIAVCKQCPHPKQFMVAYYRTYRLGGKPLEGRVCKLCGLHEDCKWTGYKVLTTLTHSEDHEHRVEFEVAMSYRTRQV